jgi:hypothetical protein
LNFTNATITQSFRYTGKSEIVFQSRQHVGLRALRP